MYAFGVDIPLVELLILIAVICIILLIEITIVMILLTRKLATTRDITKILLASKNKEIELIDRLKKKL